MISIVLFGADGRMGRAVETAAAAHPDLRIKAKIDHATQGSAADVQRGDVVVDFSSPEGFLAIARNQRSDQLVVGIERNPSGVNATTHTMRIGADRKSVV